MRWLIFQRRPIVFHCFLHSAAHQSNQSMKLIKLSRCKRFGSLRVWKCNCCHWLEMWNICIWHSIWICINKRTKQRPNVHVVIYWISINSKIAQHTAKCSMLSSRRRITLWKCGSSAMRRERECDRERKKENPKNNWKIYHALFIRRIFHFNTKQHWLNGELFNFSSRHWSTTHFYITRAYADVCVSIFLHTLSTYVFVCYGAGIIPRFTWFYH